jgi:electron transport complex protein RnfD
LPAVIAGIWLFGWNAARVIIISDASCVGFEFSMGNPSQKADHRQRPFRGRDRVILAMNLPSTAPWWLIFIGQCGCDPACQTALRRARDNSSTLRSRRAPP